jgi:hypothetical protein
MFVSPIPNTRAVLIAWSASIRTCTTAQGEGSWTALFTCVVPEACGPWEERVLRSLVVGRVQRDEVDAQNTVGNPSNKDRSEQACALLREGQLLRTREL